MGLLAQNRSCHGTIKPVSHLWIIARRFALVVAYSFSADAVGDLTICMLDIPNKLISQLLRKIKRVEMELLVLCSLLSSNPVCLLN